jgi:hypothetical protein
VTCHFTCHLAQRHMLCLGFDFIHTNPMVDLIGFLGFHLLQCPGSLVGQGQHGGWSHYMSCPLGTTGPRHGSEQRRKSADWSCRYNRASSTGLTIGQHDGWQCPRQCACCTITTGHRSMWCWDPLFKRGCQLVGPANTITHTITSRHKRSSLVTG